MLQDDAPKSLGFSIQTVIESIAARAALHPARDALIKGDEHVTYDSLWKRVLSAANHLATCGVSPGDRVLLAAPSVPAFVYGYFGAHLLGAVAIPYDPRAHVARQEELAARTQARCMFTAKAQAATAIPTRSVDEFNDGKSGASLTPPALDIDADLLFTTGSTGRSKGVRLTHRNIATSAGHINAVIQTPEAAVEVIPLPLNHSFGLGRLRCDLVAGRTVVLVDGFRLPGEIFAAIEKHKAAGLVGVPSGFAILLGFGTRGLGRYADQLRYIEIGSAPMPSRHKSELMALLPRTHLWMHYGLTEATRSAFIEFHRHKDHLDTVGLAAPGVQLSIRSTGGEPQDPAKPGLLWIGGPHISPGYWDEPQQFSANFADGWVNTGDVAHIDARGFLVLDGRNDDMIKVRGFNVSPDEIERTLAEHPAVREAACIGVPDPRCVSGQIVCAYVVPAEAPLDAGASGAMSEALSDWVASRLEPYKVPVRYEWVATLPKTESGKLLRRVLRKSGASGN